MDHSIVNGRAVVAMCGINAFRAHWLTWLVLLFLVLPANEAIVVAEDLREAMFDIDVTPPLGSRHAIDIGMLGIRDVRILHLSGELYVEYQLAAKKMRPDLRVMMPACGDYGPGYIGTEVAYSQGGYETSERASDVATEVEYALMSAIQTLLKDE